MVGLSTDSTDSAKVSSEPEVYLQQTGGSLTGVGNQNNPSSKARYGMALLDERYWRHRAVEMTQGPHKLKLVLHELLELMPQTRSLHGVKYQKLNTGLDDLVNRQEHGDLDTEQALDQFFELVFAEATV